VYSGRAREADRRVPRTCVDSAHRVLPGIHELSAKATNGLDGAAEASGAHLTDILPLVAPAVERVFVATRHAVGAGHLLDVRLYHCAR
jgi:hypothetical protein